MNIYLNRVYSPSFSSQVLRSCSHSTLSTTRLLHLRYVQHELSPVSWVSIRSIHSSAPRLADSSSQNQSGSKRQMSPVTNKAKVLDDSGLKRMPKDIVGLLDAGLPQNIGAVILVRQPGFQEISQMIQHPLIALKFLWLRLRTWAITRITRAYHMQIYGSLWNPKTYFKGKEHRWPRRKLITEAEDMYVDMYTAYAQGRRSDLHNFCGEGILSLLESRMTRRGVGAVMEWNLKSFNPKPEMVSRSVGMGPKVLGRTLSYQQAIFNLKSTQSLKRGRISSSGTVEWQKMTEKVVDEYLVLQRRFLDDVPDKWFLWGFLKGDNIMTFKQFLEQQEERKIKAKQNSILDDNIEHQSHKTVRDIAQGVNQPTS